MPLHYAITDNEAAHMFIVCLVALTTCFLKDIALVLTSRLFHLYLVLDMSPNCC